MVETADRERSANLFGIGRPEFFAFLQNDPQFQSLVRRLNFPSPPAAARIARTKAESEIERRQSPLTMSSMIPTTTERTGASLESNDLPRIQRDEGGLF